MKERYGWRVKDGILVEDPREQRNLARVRELRSRGWTLQQIKTELERRMILRQPSKQKAKNERK